MIQIKNLTYDIEQFGQYRRILEIDDLAIKKQTTTLIAGKTGAGKSSLLHLIAGLGKPTTGDILLDGESIVKLPDLFLNNMRRGKVGILFQSFHLIEELTVRDNISLALIPESLSQREIDLLITESLEKVALTHKKDQLVKTLSGGEKQKCALARVLAMNPSLILLDEPSAHLDLDATKELVHLISELEGKTIVVVSHDEEFKRMLSFDRVLTISEGKVR